MRSRTPALAGWISAAVVSGACDPGVFEDRSRTEDSGRRRTEVTVEPKDDGGAAGSGADGMSPQPAAGSGAAGSFAEAGADADANPPRGGGRALPPAGAGASPPSDAGDEPDATPIEPAPRDAGPGAGGPADAGAPDAGPPDKGKPDTGPPAPVGESSCYDRFASRLECQGFETPLQIPPWWKIEEDGSVAQIDSPTYRGTGAIRARTAAVDGKGYIGRNVFSDLTSGKIYLRSYIYVPSGVSLTGVIASGMSEGDGQYGGVSVLLTDRAIQVDVHPKGPGIEPIFLGADTPVPVLRDRWQCLQLEIGIGPAGSVKLTLDGKVAAMNTSAIATLPALGYRNIYAGIISVDHAQEPIQLLVDEVVADTAPIPCD